MNEYNFPIVIIKDRKPTIMDDETQGYIVGQPWVYQEENNQQLYYICIDNSQSNANWIVMPVFSEYVDYLSSENCIPNLQNEEYVSLDLVFSNIIFYLKNVEIVNSDLFQTRNVTENFEIVIQAIIDYLCTPQITSDFLNIQSIHSFDTILQNISEYLTEIRLNNSCLNVSTYETLHNILQAISDYLSNIYLENDFIEFSINDNLHNILQLFSDELSFIQAFNTTDNLHNILQTMTNYVCQIEITDSCLSIMQNDNLHNILVGIIDQICSIQITDTCINISQGDNIIEKIDQYLCEIPYGQVIKNLQQSLQDVVDSICYINIQNTCLDINQNDNIYNILQKIVQYLCHIDISGYCLNTGDNIKSLNEIFILYIDFLCDFPLYYNYPIDSIENGNTLHEILNGLTSYICNINIDHKCINRNFTI